MKHPRGREISYRLLPRFDVLLEQFRPGVTDRLGIGYPEVRAAHPRIIYCSLTGYGQDGPYRDRAGHDDNYLAIAGVLGLTGPRKGAPVLPGVQIADLGGGALMAAVGILAALHHRERHGEGQYIDVAMMDGALSWMAVAVADYFATGRPPEAGETRLNGGFPCYKVYPTRDGRYMSLGALEPKFWKVFCHAVGRPDLIPDQFARGERRETVEREIADIFRSKTREEWIRFLEDKDFCCEPVNSLAETVRHPQVVHRGLVVKVKGPAGEMTTQVTHPVRFSATPARPPGPAPSLGQHTEEVLSEAGFTAEEIGRLKQEGVL